MAQVDTLTMRPGGKLELHRYHTFLAKEPDIYGHLPRLFSYSDTGHYVFAIDSGTLVYTPKYFTANCFVRQIKPDSSGGNLPAQMVYANGPASIVYKGNFYPGKRPSASCYLTFGDTTVLLNNAENRIIIGQDVVRELNTLAYVDGLKWELFRSLLAGETTKDSVRLKIQMHFEKKK